MSSVFQIPEPDLDLLSFDRLVLRWSPLEPYEGIASAGAVMAEAMQTALLPLASPEVLAPSLKRLLDIVLSALLLLLTSPVLLAAMLAIRLSSPGPALFRQRRIGHCCREFRMYKLRTMVGGAEDLERQLAEDLPDRTFCKLESDPRVTGVGAFLRKYSIDELPQLFNVLRGDMSLVGPRPLLLLDLDRYPIGPQLLRFAMLPGMTGLWQVSGRSSCSDDTRIRLDLEYVDRWSLPADLRILVKTIPAVLSGKGAY